MTKGKIISVADSIRPNNYPMETKLEWVDILEKQICRHMCRYDEADITPSPSTEDAAAVLDDEHLYMYAYYLVAMIDLGNQDVAMYNNSSAYFNTLYENWQKKWRREHLPYPQKGGER